MAYSSYGDFDFQSEMKIIASFAHGLDVIASEFVKRAKRGKIGEDDDCASALRAQAALVADRLSNVLADMERLPFEVIQRFDPYLYQKPETDMQGSNVMPMAPESSRRTKRMKG